MKAMEVKQCKSYPMAPNESMLTTNSRPLFERALAELKYLGMIKGTRKKTDHIAKAAWRGL
jgi:Origin recognition complex winged helix C-terminal